MIRIRTKIKETGKHPERKTSIKLVLNKSIF